MPVLILARHAKAEAHGRTDFERSLDAKGLAQAVEAGAEIAERWSPDVAIASAARRTVQTGQAVVEAVNRAHGGNLDEPGALTLREDPSLYAGSVDDWLDAIKSIPADAKCAYIVGHQPTVAEVVGHLNPEGGVPDTFRPSSIAVFDLESWDVEPGHFPAPQIRVFHGV
ncbi:SixA phosphatase family protein [Brevibacterium linens]|uniref:SixA phosphatase family protein n=1 Tax=Brevibacterium linens TaxID=1703 RepID=UPI003F8AEE79